MSQSRPAVPEPTEIAGRYEIVQKLGAGAMGTVYKARDRMLGREVAIKTIRFESMAASQTGFDELLERFKREARVAAQLKHPNIVTIYDIGESEGLSYLAMEFIDGVGLERIIAEGKVPLGRAAGLAHQVADALGYAHQQGVIHRDIKPANIMVEAGERVKVTDFGIAKPMDSAEHLTQTGGVLGTPSYMSPEQARGWKVDGRSDLFSVGCVLYEMLAGRKAFTGDNITGILLKIISEPPTPIREHNPLLPDEIVRTVERALSKDPETRYQTGHELADDLLTLAQPGHVPTLRQADEGTHPLADLDAPTVSSPPTAQGTISSSPTVPQATPPGAPPAAGATAPVPPTQITPTPPPPPPPTPAARPRRPTAAPGRRPPQRQGRGRGFVIAAGIAALALIGVGTWFVLGRRGPTPETPVDTSTATQPTPPPADSAAPGPAPTPAPVQHRRRPRRPRPRLLGPRSRRPPHRRHPEDPRPAPRLPGPRRHPRPVRLPNKLRHLGRRRHRSRRHRPSRPRRPCRATPSSTSSRSSLPTDARPARRSPTSIVPGEAPARASDPAASSGGVPASPLTPRPSSRRSAPWPGSSAPRMPTTEGPAPTERWTSW